MRPRLLMASIALFVLAIVVALASSSGGGDRPKRTRAAAQAGVVAGIPAAFTYLASQRSNRCTLQARQIAALPDRQHLQGSCCTRMDRTTYRRQVQALRRYRGLPQIPQDPYDIQVALVKRVLRYRAQTALNRRQQRTYLAAMRASPEHGPCCCHCWRWDAFEGLSRYLIAARGWGSARLAALIGDLEGCGGRAEDQAS